MSLINQMLKDLENRHSRDLETSDSLRNNITWETGPGSKKINWQGIVTLFTIIILVGSIVYLLDEKLSAPDPEVVSEKPISPDLIFKESIDKKIQNKKSEKLITKQAKVEVIIVKAVDVEEAESLPRLKVKKKHRPLNSKQLAEIAYKKAHQFLKQGRMRQGKENLRKALSLYLPHIKAREMLAGIYIKSGRLIDAAELLHEGVEAVPEYPLFAQLYARVLLQQNNPQFAIKILKQGSAYATLNVEPDYYALLAATYQRVKNHNKAVDIYLQLVKIRPAAGIWWLGLAISLEKLGKNTTAVEAFQRAKKTGSLNADLINFINNRVSVLLANVNFQEK